MKKITRGAERCSCNVHVGLDVHKIFLLAQWWFSRKNIHKFSSTKAAFPAAEPRIVYKSQPIKISPSKNSVPAPADPTSSTNSNLSAGVGLLTLGEPREFFLFRSTKVCPLVSRGIQPPPHQLLERHNPSCYTHCELFDPRAGPLSEFQILTMCSCTITLRILEALF